MNPQIKRLLLILLAALACSCRYSSGRWLDGLSGYREMHSVSLSIEILRMRSGGDTTAINYRVRIRPSAKNMGIPGEQFNFYYKMDSCFFLRSGNKTIRPAFVEAVPNGIKGCFEYLLSFNIDASAKLRPLDLIYQDRFIDLKPYVLSLNQQ
jgi:hypothetical protein